jgi:tetratricopeptide (TPR) repeat protein
MTQLLEQGARLGWGVLLLSLISGCSSLGITPNLSEFPRDIPRQIEISDAPFFPQQENHCGPAALATLLQHRKIEVTPDDLSKLSYLPGREGSLQIELTATARQQGVVVYPLKGHLNNLLREISEENPVLILQNQSFRWFPRWHYAVAVGYDLDQQQLILRSGATRRWISDMAAFMNTWNRADNWAVVTLPPTQLPATAEPGRYLQAVHDLEQTGQQEVALQAYQQAAEQWPTSVTAWLALGNSAYALSDWPQAVAAFRRATDLEADNSTAWNNLAYALMAQDDRDKAIQAIERALSLSPDDPNLQDSEQEIRAWAQSR